MKVLGRSRYRLIDSEGRKKTNRIRRVSSFTCYRFQISKPTFAFDGDTKTFGCRHQNFGSSSKQKFTEIQKFINIGNKTVFRRRKKPFGTYFSDILNLSNPKKAFLPNFQKSAYPKFSDRGNSKFYATPKIIQNKSNLSKFHLQTSNFDRF